MPAGVYTLHGFRVVQDEWMISTTGGQSQLTVSEGKSEQVAPDATIRLDLKARREGGELKIQLAISAQRMGLSIYRRGARIPMPYTLLDANGNELAKGRLNYG